MATFDPSVPDIEPKRTIASFSQGTEPARMQPLAEVPKLSEKYVQPDYKANTSGGRALEGLGEDLKSDVGLADKIIHEKADQALTSSIDKIRDSFGVAAAADQSSGIAEAVGQAGGEGTSLTAPAAAPMPLPVSRLGNQVNGLYESYQQGGMSNSAFFAKMESAVRQVKQQFPGYENDIDTIVSTKLGTTPANALRSALLDDVTKLAQKVSSQNDKWMTFEHTNADSIYRWDPNYDKNKDKYSHDEVYAAVGKIQANTAQKASDIQSLALNKAVDEASTAKITTMATVQGHDLVNEQVNQFAKTMGINDAQGIQQYLIDVNTGKKPYPTADQKDAMRGQWATLDHAADVKLDTFFNTPASDGTTIASRLGKTAVDAIKLNAKANLNTIKEGLFDDKTGLMNAQLNHSNAVQQASAGGLLKSMPYLADAAVIKEKLGDSGVTDVFMRSAAFRDPLLQDFRTYGWGKIARGGYSLQETLGDFRKDPDAGDNGDLNRAHIQDTLSIITDASKMKDPSIAKNAVEHAFGPGNRTMIESIRGADGKEAQVPFFNTMVGPAVVKSISKMDQTHKNMFTSWAEDAFTSVFNTQVDNINLSASNLTANGKVIYDTTTNEFQYKNNTGTQTQPALMAKVSIQGLNSAIHSMENVWKLKGAEALPELYKLLPVAGVEPGSPVYKALQQAVLEQSKAEPLKKNDRASRYQQ